MSYIIREMKILTEKGLSLREFYQKEFYEPQPLEELLKRIQTLKTKYLESKELKEAEDTRGGMLEFLIYISEQLDKCDARVEEGLMDKVSKLGKLFGNFFSQERESDIAVERQKAAVEKQKAWILTGALIYIRYKIAMEYAPQLTNVWGFWSKKSTDPNCSELYKLIGDILCPLETPAYKKLQDVDVEGRPPNYFAIVQSLSALQDFLPKLEKKPEYLLVKAHRETQLGDYLVQNKNVLSYKIKSAHLDYLEKQESVIESIHSVYKLAVEEIKKFKPDTFESMENLKLVVSNLKCHDSIATLLKWSVEQIEASRDFNSENLAEKLSTMMDFISGHAIVGAHYLLRATFIRQGSEDNKPIIIALNDAMGHTKSNKIDFSNSDDVSTLVNSLMAYKKLVSTYPDQEVHKALWRGMSLESMIEDAISNLDRVQEPTESPSL